MPAADLYICLPEDVGEVEVRRANGFFNDFSRAELRVSSKPPAGGRRFSDGRRRHAFRL